jgi:hypothetical protein
MELVVILLKGGTLVFNNGPKKGAKRVPEKTAVDHKVAGEIPPPKATQPFGVTEKLVNLKPPEKKSKFRFATALVAFVRALPPNTTAVPVVMSISSIKLPFDLLSEAVLLVEKI